MSVLTVLIAGNAPVHTYWRREDVWSLYLLYLLLVMYRHILTGRGRMSVLTVLIVGNVLTYCLSEFVCTC